MLKKKWNPCLFEAQTDIKSNCLHNYKQMHIHVVVTHFTEPWNYVWQLYQALHANIHNDTWEMIVYHKNGKQDLWTGSVPQNVKIVELPNIGRESFSVHYHIYENYDNLPDLLMFIPANITSRQHVIHDIIVNKHTNQFRPFPQLNTPWEYIRSFTIDEWHGSSEINRAEVINQNFTVSEVRPFGNWYQKQIPVAYKGMWSLYGTFSVPKAHVMRYDRVLYKKWLDELYKNGTNPEIGHYWERTWYSLFS